MVIISHVKHCLKYPDMKLDKLLHNLGNMSSKLLCVLVGWMKVLLPFLEIDYIIKILKTQ